MNGLCHAFVGVDIDLGNGRHLRLSVPNNKKAQDQLWACYELRRKAERQAWEADQIRLRQPKLTKVFVEQGK